MSTARLHHLFRCAKASWQVAHWKAIAPPPSSGALSSALFWPNLDDMLRSLDATVVCCTASRDSSCCVLVLVRSRVPVVGSREWVRVPAAGAGLLRLAPAGTSATLALPAATAAVVWGAQPAVL